jgi:hypothetical protein
MPARTSAPCLRCGDDVEINNSTIQICQFCRTAGIEEAVRSPQDQVSCCSGCAIAIAKGDEPPKTQSLNRLAYHQIRYILANSPAMYMKAWMELRKSLGLPAPSFSDPAVSGAWTQLRKTLEPSSGELAEAEILPPLSQRKLAS